MREPVVITHHRKPRFVLMSVESYEQLAAAGAGPPAELHDRHMPDDLREGLLALADSYDGRRATVPIDRPETGLVMLYNFCWATSNERGAKHGRKAGQSAWWCC